MDIQQQQQEEAVQDQQPDKKQGQTGSRAAVGLGVAMVPLVLSSKVGQLLLLLAIGVVEAPCCQNVWSMGTRGMSMVLPFTQPSRTSL